VSGNGWDRPQFFPNEVLGIYISSATIGTVLPVLNDVVTRFDRVVTISSALPTNLVFLHEVKNRDLEYFICFQWNKSLGDKLSVPVLIAGVYNILEKLKVSVSRLRGPSWVRALVMEPSIHPNINILPLPIFHIQPLLRIQLALVILCQE
jgi:hypothetical protein